jgi:hypothetical protein
MTISEKIWLLNVIIHSAFLVINSIERNQTAYLVELCILALSCVAFVAVGN